MCVGVLGDIFLHCMAYYLENSSCHATNKDALATFPKWMGGASVPANKETSGSVFITHRLCATSTYRYILCTVLYLPSSFLVATLQKPYSSVPLTLALFLMTLLNDAIMYGIGWE